MGIYTSAAAVIAEPEVPDNADPAIVEGRIAVAEDLIDGWLGPWPIHAAGVSAGRKIDQAAVLGWQWAKLARATTRLAARLHQNPGLLDGPSHASISGPDFSTSNPSPTLRKIADVIVGLNLSGLRITAGRAR